MNVYHKKEINDQTTGTNTLIFVRTVNTKKSLQTIFNSIHFNFNWCNQLGVNGSGSLSTPMIRQKRMILQAKEAVQQKYSNWFQEQIQED